MSYQRFASTPLDGMEQSHIEIYVVEEYFAPQRIKKKPITVHILCELCTRMNKS